MMRDIKNEVRDDNIIHFRFRRVLFGASPSPFLMNATIQHHLDSYQDDWVADDIKGSLYSDNLISGVASDDVGFQYYEQSKKIFQDAGMNLCQWLTNSSELQQRFENPAETGVAKVLGACFRGMRGSVSSPQTPKDQTNQMTEGGWISYFCDLLPIFYA